MVIIVTSVNSHSKMVNSGGVRNEMEIPKLIQNLLYTLYLAKMVIAEQTTSCHFEKNSGVTMHNFESFSIFDETFCFKTASSIALEF